ncbi:MAG: hypothetical protein ACQEQO_10505 [Thermodesulfobacteriota bacterium]
MTKNMITPHAGSALLDEFAARRGFLDPVDRYIYPGLGMVLHTGHLNIHFPHLNTQRWWLEHG